jgi:hypothetical protein
MIIRFPKARIVPIPEAHGSGAPNMGPYNNRSTAETFRVGGASYALQLGRMPMRENSRNGSAGGHFGAADGCPSFGAAIISMQNRIRRRVTGLQPEIAAEAGISCRITTNFGPVVQDKCQTDASRAPDLRGIKCR